MTISQWSSGEPSNDNEHCLVICKSNGTWCDQQCSLSRHHICESSAYYENQIEALNDLLTSETENLQTKITENSQRIKNISPNQQCYDFPKIANGYVVDTDSKYFYGDEARVGCHKGKSFFFFYICLPF